MKDEIIGNFRVVEKIGAGGMGEVWVAEQKDLGTRVAIKVLMDQISRDHEQVQRFFNEARAVSRIPHSGIAKISDAGFTATGRAYLVMELLDGETLASAIRRAKRMSLAQIAEIGSQIASVLGATHKQGITHRDLKPDNIFLVVDAERESGKRVKILDFGIAKLTGTLGAQSPSTVGAMGTPAYMAPEQWGNAGSVDWRADLYSLGCVLFEMACGRPPFVGEHFADLCAKHLTVVPPNVSDQAPGMPRTLDALVARLLAKKPEDRGASMKEVEREIAQLGEGAAALAPPLRSATGEVAVTMAPDVPTVQPDVAVTMPPDQPTVAPPPQRAETVAPKPVAPAIDRRDDPPRSPLPYVIAGVLLAAGAVAAIVVATQHSSSPAKPLDAGVALVVPPPIETVAPDAAGGEPITCALASERVAGFVKATDRLRPDAQGAVRTVIAAHCASDRWPVATLGCVASSRDLAAVVTCLQPLGKDKFDQLGKDMETESARVETGWVVVGNREITLIEPIQLDGDEVREESKPLVAALARVLMARDFTIEIAARERRATAVRNLLVLLGVPGEQMKTTATTTDGVEIRPYPPRLEQLKAAVPATAVPATAVPATAVPVLRITGGEAQH